VNKIDVHILTVPGRDQWLQECLASLGGQPVNVYTVPGVVGHVGRGRERGYRQGDSEWVSFVDDDDLVLPGAFDAMLAAIREFPAARAFFGREEMIDERGNVILRAAADVKRRPYRWIDFAHHLAVYHRETLYGCLDRFLEIPVRPEQYMASWFRKNHVCVTLPTMTYQWRIHSGNHHRSVEARRIMRGGVFD
jgi:glycosyltransferase involved in cell wall biosynthesis